MIQSRAILLIAGLMLLGACAEKKVAPPAPGAPRFPEFVYPAEPAGLGTSAALERHKAGWAWLQAGDLHAADRNFSASLKLSPDFYPSEVGLGYSALARKDNDAALLHFDKAVVANPRYAPALVGRGDALLASGKRSLALQSFETALSADTQLSNLRSRIEVLRVRELQEDVEIARKAADAGRFPDARKAYEEAIKSSPQSQFLYRELASVERRQGDLVAALAHAQQAIELDPGDARALLVAGEIHESRGDFAAALESFRASAALEPSDALEARIEKLRERAALSAMPEEFKSIESSPTLTRAQLAALVGVRLESVLKRSSQNGAVVITDTRGSWAAPWILSVTSAGVMEVYPNHTFQPSAQVQRADLARTASRILTLIAAENPTLGEQWRNASRRRFPDVSPGHLSYPAVSFVVEAGIMAPAADGSFQLSRSATGAEAAEAVRKLEEFANSSRRR
jgi:tetratricopeptide (TPR) repeat protein